MQYVVVNTLLWVSLCEQFGGKLRAIYISKLEQTSVIFDAIFDPMAEYIYRYNILDDEWHAIWSWSLFPNNGYYRRSKYLL